jgi:hypothetical protein
MRSKDGIRAIIHLEGDKDKQNRVDFDLIKSAFIGRNELWKIYN